MEKEGTAQSFLYAKLFWWSKWGR